MALHGVGASLAPLIVESANLVAQRNGTSAQSYYIYNTYTDGSNYRRLELLGTSAKATSAGTGGSFTFEVGTGAGNNGALSLVTNDTSRWSIGGSTGHMLAATDATYDIGASGATRPRNLYISGYLAAQPPSTQSGTTYSVSATDYALIFTAASTCTVTLPAAASFTGRQLRMKGTGGATVVSASSNVVPRAGGAAGTAILAAAAGSWAELISDGTNWIIMAGA